MIRRPLQRTLVATALVLTLAGVTGCANATRNAAASADPCARDERRNIGFLGGAMANGPHGSLPPTAVELLSESAATNGSVTVFVPSGHPESMGSTTLGSDANDAVLCTQDQKQAVRAAVHYLDAMQASNPQADYLDGLDALTRTVGRTGVGIVVAGSGLQTVDPLDMSSSANVLAADPRSVAKDLARRHVLPNLNGITVYWVGLGQVSGEQAPLGILDRSRLEDLWRAVIRASGGHLVLLDGEFTGTARSDLPPVATVKIVPPKTRDWTQPVKLSESEIRFTYRSDEFEDPVKAQALLEELAPAIMQSDETLRITGTASKDGASSNEADEALSLRRAERVRAALVAAHVPVSQLEVAGVGHEWCGFRSEKTPLDAAANRTIIIGTPAASLC